MEILKIVKEELQKTQGCDQIKTYNRAIEVNDEYACDLYKSAINRLNDQQIEFDVRCQTFEEYKERGNEETVERTKFDVIYFTHSIYYLDINESLSHCLENELNANGSLFIMVNGVDLIYWVLDKPQGAPTICLCSRLLIYSKCSGFTVCLTYSDISLTMYINQ